MMNSRLLIALVVVGVVLALTGCANMKTQWVINLSYQSDNVIEDLKKARHEQVPDQVRP